VRRLTDLGVQRLHVDRRFGRAPFAEHPRRTGEELVFLAVIWARWTADLAI
jgi:hypothetical protein